MNVWLVYAHPSDNSLNAEILRRAKKTIESNHELRVIDLYAEKFDPVLTPERYQRFNDLEQNTIGVEQYVADVEWAEAMIFVYPTWWYGLPAILKGWLERVLIPGVAMHINEKGKPCGAKLSNIKIFGAISTYGAPWVWTKFIGDPGRRTLMRGVRFLSFPFCRTFWLAEYNVHNATPKRIASALNRFDRKLSQILNR